MINSINNPYTLSDDGRTLLRWRMNWLGDAIIPDGVTTIGKNAFLHCVDIERIHIPNSVVKIENSAFTNCLSLQQINIPAGIKSIDNMAFDGCDALKEIVIPRHAARLIRPQVSPDILFRYIEDEKSTSPSTAQRIKQWLANIKTKCR